MLICRGRHEDTRRQQQELSVPSAEVEHSVLSSFDRFFHLHLLLTARARKKMTKVDTKLHLSTFIRCNPIAAERGCPLLSGLTKNAQQKTGLVFTNPDLGAE